MEKNSNTIALHELTRLLSKKYHYIYRSMKSNFEVQEDEKIADCIVDYYESILSCMPGNVYWIDRNCTTVGCNKNVLAMFGLRSPEQFKGLTFEEMGKIGGWSVEATASFKKDTLEVIQTGRPKLNVEEPPIPNYEGKIIYFLTSRVPLLDHSGFVIGVVGISIDITERKEMEIALKQEKEKAEVANKAKTEFLENMRHDLRTPLSGIIGFASLLKEKIDDPQKKEYVDNLVISSNALLDVLNEVLDTITVNSGDIPITTNKFNLKSRIEEVIKLYQAKALQKNLSLNFEFDDTIPKYLIGDSFRIHRIILELIANALNFTHEGHVTLSVNLAKQDQKNIIIKLIVEDTGIGIDEDKQQEIFLPFKKISPSYQGIYKGLGLGLSTVKQFIDDIDGEIYVESQKGSGCAFTCILPFRKTLLLE